MTGTVPFNGETLGELFIAILEQPPPPVSHKRPDVPQVLSDAIMRCLQRQIDLRFSNVAELAQAIASCAPARSFTSVERVTQALGLPKPTLVGPMSGSMPDGRAAMPSYAGNPNTPNPYTSSQSGPRPAQFSSSNSGVHQFSPQGGTQMLGSQTGNSGWGNTAGAQPPASKAPLIAGLVLGGLVLVGGGVGGVLYATHKSAATTPTATATATDTAKTADTSTAATSTSTTATTSTATASASTSATATTTNTTAQTAPTTTHTGTGTAATATHTGHGQPTATATQTTAATATTTKPANTGAFNPLDLGRHQ